MEILDILELPQSLFREGNPQLIVDLFQIPDLGINRFVDCTVEMVQISLIDEILGAELLNVPSQLVCALFK